MLHLTGLRHLYLVKHHNLLGWQFQCSPKPNMLWLFRYFPKRNNIQVEKGGGLYPTQNSSSSSYLRQNLQIIRSKVPSFDFQPPTGHQKQQRPQGVKHPASVTVLLALYQGTEHLDAQLQSYVEQDLPPARVIASDDNQGDGTGERFQRFADHAAGPTHWTLLPGPKRGLTANFLHLLSAVDPEEADFIALSDQDDIWLPEKISSAVEILNAATTLGSRPMLLGTRSWEWIPELDQKRLSRSIPAPLDFTHALVQNFAGGNTMVLNRAALRLVQRALPDTPIPAMHDWWLYQLISGAGGEVLLDSEPRLLYRQHADNQVGANSTLGSKIRRFSQMLSGTYRQWMDQNLAALHHHEALLTPENARLLARVSHDRDATLPRRLQMLRQTRIHRKGRANQTALWIAAALRRM